MRNQKGIFLISTYLALSVIGTFSMALFLKNINIYHAAQRAENRIRAFHQAESGTDWAITRLRSDLSYKGQGYSSLGNDGGYQIFVEAPDASQPALRRITATGHSPSNAANAYAYAQRQIVSYVTFAPSAGGYGIFSDMSIQMSGNFGTDSYNSNRAPYNSSNPGRNGDVGTNTTGAGMVMLSGNLRIRGDMTVGPGGNPSRVIVMSGNAVIEGSRTAAPKRKILEPVQIPQNLTNQGNLRVNGNTRLTLPGGEYWYSSIDITGNGNVKFTGPATVYVSGAITLSGNGLVNYGNIPGNLRIKVQGTRQVNLSGNADLFASVYAPTSDTIITGNGDIYGEVLGKTIQGSGNGKVHYDEALADESAGSTITATLKAWTEV